MQGFSSSPCWQLTGNWLNGMRQFSIYFWEEDINGKKAFSQAEGGAQPSTLESFMIDERRKEAVMNSFPAETGSDSKPNEERLNNPLGWIFFEKS